jgi:PAT family beta-lactamase induction signal transducer AmpG
LGLVLQACLLVSILGLAVTHPSRHVLATASWSVAVAFFSASQDVVVDAFRIESLTLAEQGAGASAYQFGYRMAMLASGAGALVLADNWGWEAAYAFMAWLVLAGMLAFAFSKEPASAPPVGTGIGAWFRSAVLHPFADFMKRPGWAAILAFVVLLPLGETIMGRMANPFYLEMGFTKTEIAEIAKTFGLVATLVGVMLGGAAVSRFGTLKTLLACGSVQALTHFLFAWLATKGHAPGVLATAVAADNLATGMVSTATIAYLSSLCSVAYTATQYALLSSLASFGRTVIASGSGWIADRVSWVAFFVITTIAAIPGLLLLAWMMRRYPERPAPVATAPTVP